MGVWGPGNFENDTAAGYVHDFALPLLAQIEAALADPESLEPDQYDGNIILCNIEMLALMFEQGMGDFPLPDGDVVRGWMAAYLAVWDRTIDSLEPKAEYKRRRRAVIVETFARLEAVARARV